MMAKTYLAALTAALLLALVPVAPAAPMTVYITTNETIGLLPPKPVTVVIGYADASHSFAYSPTVGFNAGSSNPNIIDTYNSSMLNVTDGTLTGLAAYDRSTMNISGGVVSAQINVNDNATLNITGGNESSPDISANDSGTINFSNGSAESTQRPRWHCEHDRRHCCTGFFFRHGQPFGRQRHRDFPGARQLVRDERENTQGGKSVFLGDSALG